MIVTKCDNQIIEFLWGKCERKFCLKICFTWKTRPIIQQCFRKIFFFLECTGRSGKIVLFPPRNVQILRPLFLGNTGLDIGCTLVDQPIGVTVHSDILRECVARLYAVMGCGELGKSTIFLEHLVSWYRGRKYST